MEQYIRKSDLIVEIERRRDAALMRQHNLEAIGQETVLNEMVANELNRILSLLDAIEMKEVQEELVNEDLERAAQEYVTKEGYLAGLHYNSMVRSFKTGAEWYAYHNTKLPDNLLLAARKASIAMCNFDDRYIDEYPYNPIAEKKFIEGSLWQKKHLLKKAAEWLKELGSDDLVEDFKNYMER